MKERNFHRKGISVVLSIYSNSDNKYIPVSIPFIQSQSSNPFTGQHLLQRLACPSAFLRRHFGSCLHIAIHLCVITAPLHKKDAHMLQVVKDYPESQPLHPVFFSLLSAANTRLNKMTRDRPNSSPPQEHLFSCSTGLSPEAPWCHSATGLLSKRPRH